jgi:phosphoribosylformylglycinamidine synthase PurS subunit
LLDGAIVVDVKLNLVRCTTNEHPHDHESTSIVPRLGIRPRPVGTIPQHAIQQLTLDGTRLRAAVSSNMHNIGLASISNVRIGKHITLEVEAADQASAEAQVKEACEKLLANQIMEAFTFTMEAVETVA